MSCNCGEKRCGPSKFSPEFYQNKLQKPQNHSTCCSCNCKNEEEVVQSKTVKRGCYVRYKACKGKCC